MTGSVFQLTQAVYDEIICPCPQKGKPQEVCGLVRGRDNCGLKVARSRNLAPDPIHDYVVNPHTLLLQFEFEKAGDEMVAIYHSHPVTPAYPSASDAWNAYYPECVYLICSLHDDPAPDLRAFRLIDHDVPIDVIALHAALDWDETRPGRLAYFQPADVPAPPILQPIAAQVPAPFFLVYEIDQKTGKHLPPRVISVHKVAIQILADGLP